MAYFLRDETAEGQLQHRETKTYFEFRKTSNRWAIENDCFHELAMSDGSVRFAKLLKTVAYVATDEDNEGKAVIEKWPIKLLWSRQPLGDIGERNATIHRPL